MGLDPDFPLYSFQLLLASVIVAIGSLEEGKGNALSSVVSQIMTSYWEVLEPVDEVKMSYATLALREEPL